ncbi:protein of unknown function [Methylorubrum extorquens]|uniref:DUF3489 domain-containing protein n=1 Tax=Methylorubrum extorquens TaxID=408 RepID=A0A2N9AXW2_METEX|nr:DUF3489 domain-containing protein [Methylobacterium sp. Leaf122]KQQ24113.1 hypothetical protein ASF56_16305 [Methylobacterium sp. Leaf122]SOR32150.1 protein of unknown function [Methylorubrum extorquens]
MPRKTAETLSQTQRLILTHAAQHPKQRVLCPDTIKPPTFRASLSVLRTRGLIVDMPHAEGKLGRQACLIITAEGRAAIGITPPAPAAPEEPVGSAPPSGADEKPQRSKQALLIALLSQPDGATLEALATATHWLPHTTRAALTRLRQRGLAILTVRAAGVSTRYKLAEQSLVASAEAMA